VKSSSNATAKIFITFIFISPHIFYVVKKIDTGLKVRAHTTIITYTMSQKVLLPKSVDMSKVTFSDMRTLDNGAKSVYINLDSCPLIIQTPAMFTPFGLSKYNAGDSTETKVGEREKWTLQLAMRDIDTKESMGNFYKLLKSLDASILNAGVEKSKVWFKKQLTPEVLKELCTSLIIYPKDKVTGEITDKYPPMFRITVPVVDGKVACDCYDENKEKLTLNTIDKGSQVTAIIKCNGIWIAGSKFGCSWTPLQLKVINKVGISGYAFLGDDEEDASKQSKKEFVESSDDDEEEPKHVDDDLENLNN